RFTAVDGSLLDALGRFSSGGPCYAIRSLACLGVSGAPSFPTRVQSNHTLLCASQKEKFFFVARKGWSSLRLGVSCQDKGEGVGGEGGGELYGGASLHRALAPFSLPVRLVGLPVCMT
ncbi:unnamed protein product, partial [Ectocarpus sp. 12 AP-2014]